MTYEVKSLNEECGVFGIWGHPDAAKLTYFGLHSLQHRGQEGAGILSNDQGQLKRHRDMGLLSEVFRNPANLDKLTGTSAIGHVRYATAGEASVDNIQPFLFRFHDMQFGLAHNGNLTNAESLKKELEQRRYFQFNFGLGNLGSPHSSESQSELDGQNQRGAQPCKRWICLYPAV